MTQPSGFGPPGATTVQLIGAPGSQGTPGPPGVQGPQGAVANAATHAALRGQAGVTGTVMMVSSRATVGDGGGGQFEWIATGSPPTDNGGTIIVPNAGAGYWRRIFSGPHDVRWFGARGDNTTDDTAAIQATIDAVHNQFVAVQLGGSVYLPAGPYRVSAPLRLYAGIRLVGDSMGSASLNGTILNVLSTFSGDAVIRCDDRRINNWGVAIENLSILVPISGVPSLVNVVDWSGVIEGRIIGVTIRTGSTMRANTVGLLFSGDDGTTPDVSICYSNTVENVNVALVSTAVRFKTDAVGGMTLCRLSNFYLQQCDTAIRIEAQGGGTGLVFIDGYVNPNANGKLVSVSSNVSLQAQFINVEWESAGNPTSDLPVINGVLQSWHFAGPGPGATLVCEGRMASYAPLQIVVGSQGQHLGESAATPILPNSTNSFSSLSGWCRIPSGTVLSAGKTVFQFYSGLGIATSLIPDVYAKACVTADGGLAQPFSIVVSTSFTAPSWNPTVNYLTYTVTIYLATGVTLASNLDFFLDGAQSAPASNARQITTGYA